MINIAFYCSDIRLLAGTERASLTIANELSKLENFNVLIISNQGYKNESKIEIAENIKVCNLNFIYKGRQYFQNVLKLSKLIREYNINVFVSVEIISLFFTFPALVLNKNVKYIVWEHFNFTTNLGVPLRSFCRKVAARFADGIVVLTQKDVQLWKKNLNISGCIVSINNPSPFEISKRQYSISSKNIIAVGRLVDQKGFDRLINIWGTMKVRNLIPKEWKLQIIGSGPDEVMLKALAQTYELGDLIEFVNNTDSIREYYENAAFLAMTSRFEGLPMTLIEAQSFGLPIIAYDCLTGPAEIVSSKSGMTINDNNSEDFISGLRILMGDINLRQKMGENAKIEAGRFAPEKIRVRWEKFVTDLF